MRNHAEWAGHLEVMYMSKMLDKTIAVVKSSPDTKPSHALEMVKPESNSHDRKPSQQPAMEGQDDIPLKQHILVGHIHEKHYVSLKTVKIRSGGKYLTNQCAQREWAWGRAGLKYGKVGSKFRPTK